MAISRDALLRLARAGAATRVNELQAELESIYRTFPDLRSGGRGRATTARAAAPAQGSRRRRSWSAADRKAASERMKKYWATRNAKTAKKS